MANRTGCLIDRVILMSLLKGSLGAIVAAETKRSFSLYQKIFLVRAVGEVAGGTAFLPYFMYYLLFIIVFLVALEAGFVPLSF